MILPLLSLNFNGCAKNAYVVHPGAVDKVDSATYDMLLMANGALTSAKDMYSQGKLPEAKNIINNAGRTYNVLRDAWLGYRSAVSSVKKGEYLNIINDTIPKVKAFIDSLTEMILKVKTAEVY
jgi:hypothetical protein